MGTRIIFAQIQNAEKVVVVGCGERSEPHFENANNVVRLLVSIDPEGLIYVSRKLFKSALTVGSMTLISRVLGLLRDIVIARSFGSGPLTDAFLVAFKIPNFFRRLFAEGAFTQAFVPVLALQKKASKDDVQAFVDRITGSLGLVLLLITMVGIIAAPILIAIFAPGFLAGGGRYDLASQMLRLTFPYLFFISLTAVAGGILNSYGRFWVPAFTPVFLNLCMIGATLWLAPLMTEPITALAWGVLLAGIVQLAFQVPFIWQLGLLPKPRVDFKAPVIRQVGKMLLPAILGVSVTQINLLVDMLLASFLQAGSISWLYYSDRLVEFPLGVFGIALATVILPSLSMKNAADDPQAFSKTIDWALRWVFLIGIPSTLGLMVLAGPMLSTLFQYGEFREMDVHMATQSLQAYTFGLLAFIGIKILAPGFYARLDTRTPVRVAVIAMLTNIILNLILVYPLQHMGLALATSLAAWVNGCLLFFLLKSAGVYRIEPGWLPFALRVLMASIVMMIVLLWGVGDMDHWFAQVWWQRALELLQWVSIGTIVYFGSLIILGQRFKTLLHS